jgi:hemerythrin superfamily protein
MHAACEEQVLYPSLRNILKDDGGADKSLHEHQEVKELLEQFRNTNPSDAKYMQLANRTLWALIGVTKCDDIAGCAYHS